MDIDGVQVTGLIMAWIVMGIGILGCILPAVPGAPLVFVGALAHRLYFGAEQSVNNIVVLIIVLILCRPITLQPPPPVEGSFGPASSRSS